MGRQLYQQHPPFRAWMDELSELAEPHAGVGLTQLLYGSNCGPDDLLTRTSTTHPIIFVFHYALARCLKEQRLNPTLWLGYSLGELTACALADILSLEDAVRLTCQIGRLLEEAAPPGAMLAVLASPDSLPRGALDRCALACRNYSQHIVLSGPRSHLEELRGQLRAKGIVAELLPVQHAFHSPDMDALRGPMSDLAKHVPIQTPSRPVFSCCLQRELTKSDLSPDYFWRLHREPVEFAESIHILNARLHPAFLDLSATATLAAFAHRLLGPSNRHRVQIAMSSFGLPPSYG